MRAVASLPLPILLEAVDSPILVNPHDKELFVIVQLNGDGALLLPVSAGYKQLNDYGSHTKRFVPTGAWVVIESKLVCLNRIFIRLLILSN